METTQQTDSASAASADSAAAAPENTMTARMTTLKTQCGIFESAVKNLSKLSKDMSKEMKEVEKLLIKMNKPSKKKKGGGQRERVKEAL
jgi:hypothetical protein